MTEITTRRLAGPPDYRMAVTVETEHGRTEHEVGFTETERRFLVKGRMDAERLTRAAFEFLLVRESNLSILKEFRLLQIADYYPDFFSEIAKL